MIIPTAVAADDGIRIGPYHFAAKITRINVATLIFAAMATLMMLTFVNFVQGYVLTEFLKIPRGEQGALVGALAAWQEVVVVVVMSFIGSVSDKTGRRKVYVVGLVILGIGYATYPLADSVIQLYLLRVMVAVGSAIVSVMLAACSQDYIKEGTRGKFLGLTSIANGLGVILMSRGLASLPKTLQAMGYDAVDAGVYTFWLTAGLCFIYAAVLAFGLAGPETMKVRPREPLRKLVAEGFGAARNPRIALTYLAGFALRGDLVVVGTFFSLWLIQEGADRGMPTGEVMALAGKLFGFAITGAVLVWAPIMGFICDRVNRVVGVIISFSLATCGYFGMGFIGSPLDSAIIVPMCILLGMGETSNVIAGGSLLGQEAPARIRGSVVGIFNWCGAIGIMVFVFMGGIVFDQFFRGAPFVMMGIVNAIVVTAAIIVWRTSPGPSIADARAGRTASQAA